MFCLPGKYFSRLSTFAPLGLFIFVATRELEWCFPNLKRVCMKEKLDSHILQMLGSDYSCGEMQPVSTDFCHYIKCLLSNFKNWVFSRSILEDYFSMCERPLLGVAKKKLEYVCVAFWVNEKVREITGRAHFKV